MTRLPCPEPTPAPHQRLGIATAAILLIAAKLQDAIASAMAQHDFETDVRAETYIEQLMAINNQQLEILQELRALRGNS
ncbi:hypothetical protein AB6813_00210 [bacterium RCC_150]